MTKLRVTGFWVFILPPPSKGSISAVSPGIQHIFREISAVISPSAANWRAPGTVLPVRFRAGGTVLPARFTQTISVLIVTDIANCLNIFLWIPRRCTSKKRGHVQLFTDQTKPGQRVCAALVSAAAFTGRSREQSAVPRVRPRLRNSRPEPGPGRRRDCSAERHIPGWCCPHSRRAQPWGSRPQY